MTDFAADSSDPSGDNDSDTFLPPLELLTPAAEDMIVIRCPEEPLHITPQDAIDLGRIGGIESAEFLIVNAGEKEIAALVLCCFYTVDDALDAWDTHLTNLAQDSHVTRQAPPFTLAQIASVREQSEPYAYTEISAPEEPDALHEWNLSPAAQALLARRQEANADADEDFEQYDQVFALLLSDAVITTDVARNAARRLIEDHLTDLAIHGPIVNDYIVPDGFREAQIEYMDAEGDMYYSETREEYLKKASRRDALWLDKMAPLMSELNATRLVNDSEEREWSEESASMYEDDILMERTPLPVLMAQQMLEEPSPMDDPIFVAASEELRIPLPDMAAALEELESQRGYVEMLPELALERTITLLRERLDSPKK